MDYILRLNYEYKPYSFGPWADAKDAQVLSEFHASVMHELSKNMQFYAYRHSVPRGIGEIMSITTDFSVVNKFGIEKIVSETPSVLSKALKEHPLGDTEHCSFMLSGSLLVPKELYDKKLNIEF